MKWCLAIAVLSLLSCISTASILTLTDSTFEHLTQATTGSTTGHYLVYFHAASAPSLPLLSSLDELALEESHGIILSTVSLPTSPNLQSRFLSVLSSSPSSPSEPADTLVYIRSGKLYNLPVTSSSSDAASFLTHGYTKSKHVPVPPEPTIFSSLMSITKEMHLSPKLVGIGMACVAFGAVFAVAAFANSGKGKAE